MLLFEVVDLWKIIINDAGQGKHQNFIFLVTQNHDFMASYISSILRPGARDYPRAIPSNRPTRFGVGRRSRTSPTSLPKVHPMPCAALLIQHIVSLAFSCRLDFRWTAIHSFNLAHLPSSAIERPTPEHEIDNISIVLLCIPQRTRWPAVHKY